LVYSPSLNLPDNIQKDETTLLVAYEKLPSTGEFVDDGIIVSLQQSFSDYFNLQIKYWTDLNTYKTDVDYLHGASLTAYFMLSDTTDTYKFIVAPTVGASMRENEFEMLVVGSWIAIKTPEIWVLKPYFGLGLVYANTNFNSSDQYGFGLLSNIGFNIPLSSKIKFNFEFSFPLKIDMYWQTAYLFYTPTVGLSFSF
jgi:hypothetical protein